MTDYPVADPAPVADPVPVADPAPVAEPPQVAEPVEAAVVVVARLHPDPARLDDVVAAVRAAVPGIRAEMGCEQYDPHLADDGTILIVERWSSREALAAHNTGAAVQVLRDGVAGLTVAPTQVTVAQTL